MFGEASSSILSGSTALSFVAYGLFSAFITGPELLHREAELKLLWPQQCQQLVYRELQEQHPRKETMPQIDLGGLLDGMFGGDASTAFGDIIKPVQDAIDLSKQYEQQAERLNEERLRKKAEAAGSRCACAVTMLTEHRVSLGIYAASGRIITPSVFNDLSSSLQTSLRSTQCNQRG